MGGGSDRICNILERDFEYMKVTNFDITLKDVQTVQSDPNRVIEWVKIVKKVIEKTF